MIRKILCFIVVLLTPFFVLSLLKGDVNGDGKVTVADFTLIRRYMLGYKIDSNEEKRADVNGDKKINVKDFNLIRKIIVDGTNEEIDDKPVDSTSATSICESVKNNSSIDYKSFQSLSKKDKSSDKYKDDYPAIKAAHNCANKYNKPVVVTKSDYHIYKRNTESVIVKTSVNLNNSKIYIHDENGVVKKTDYYIQPVYSIKHDNCVDKKIKFNTLKYGSVISELSGSSNGRYIKVTDSSRTVFMRYGYGGANKNNGHEAIDAFRVDKNGKIIDPLFWNYDNKKVNVTMCDIPVNTVTFKNGNFYTIVADVTPTFSDKHFRRGIQINRSNVIVDNINHRYVNTNNKNVTKINYNYAGWFRIIDASNITFQNSKVQAMYNNYNNKKTYIYDISMDYATNVYVKNVSQYDYDGSKEYFSKSSNQLKDNLWGVMGSDGVKNITFDNCVLNRIDAHEFFYNLTVKNSKVGYWGINVGGYGKMLIENTDVYYSDHFINLRGDYGSVWNGSIEINNCSLHPNDNSSSVLINYDLVKEGGLIHNYGYDLYLPSVIVNKYKVYNTSTSLKVFNTAGGKTYLSQAKINGGKYRLYYPKSNNIVISNATNKNGNKLTVSNNLTY